MASTASVENYLAAVDEPARSALLALRDTIRTAVPETTEAISHQMPTFKFRGKPLVAYGAFKDHCSLFPMSMSVIETYESELEPYRASKGTLHFHPAHPLPKALVRKIVKARSKEIAAKTRG